MFEQRHPFFLLMCWIYITRENLRTQFELVFDEHVEIYSFPHIQSNI